jgi:hypothetical protein
MQLQKIHDYLAAYREWLPTPAAEERLYYWESQKSWQDHWDADAIDFAAMYDRCLQNQTNRRLWSRQAYEPKRMLLTFAAQDPHFVHAMFTDLFHEEKDALSRADRFVFYCDQLFQQHRKANPQTRDNSHYHDDGYGMVSLYLSFRYPAQYAPYDAERLRQLLQRLGATNIPLAGDFSRHHKVMRTLQNFLHKDAELLARHQLRLQPDHYAGESLLLAFDFASFIVG